VAGERILIVNPDAGYLEKVAEQILSAHGFKPLLAYNQHEGIKLAVAKSPQLLLIHLPLDSVLQLLQKILQSGNLIPSILILEQGLPYIPVELLRLGVQDYILDPFTNEEILQTVRRVLARENRSLDYQKLTGGLSELNHTLEERIKKFEGVLNSWGSTNTQEDLDSILNRVTEAAVSVTDAETGYLFLLDEKTNELRLRASQNLNQGQLEAFQIQREDSVIKSIVRSGKPILLSGNNSQYFEHKINYPIKSLLNVPLKINEKVIGALGVDNQTTNSRFSLVDLRRLTELADMAAAAIVKTRQYADARREISRHIEQSTTLQAVTSQLGHVTDFNMGAQLALSLALRSTNAEAGVLAWSPEGLHRPVQYIHQGNLTRQKLTSKNGASQTWWDEQALQEVIESGQSALMYDLGHRGNGKEGSKSKGHARSRLAVPMRRRDQVLGVINLESSLPNAFTQDDLNFVTGIADQIVIALEGALLQEKATLEHKRLELLMLAVDNGIWMIDADLRVTAQNQAAFELLGWPETEMIGRLVYEFEHTSLEGSSSPLAQLCSQAIDKQLVLSCEELLLTRKKDTPSVVQAKVVPIILDGKGIGAICAFYPSRKGDEQVRFEFANMASHLLRTPLTSIQASVDVLLNSNLESNEQQTVLGRIREQSTRMREFVKELLEMSRLEAGVVRVYGEPVALIPVIERVLGLMRYEEPQHTFSFSVTTTVPIVTADLGKTELILVNLLRSAVGRCVDEAHITVEVETPNDTEVIISITDDGEAIPMAQLDRIFSQFYPVDSTNGTVMSTYHLGLYSTKRLIELQNGRVWVESQSGRGSRFSFSLPIWR
jgi:signal transduction histidine kinase/DNA-binding response OmpR family regulator